MRIAELVINQKTARLFQDKKLWYVLVAAVVYVLDAWLLGSLTVMFVDFKKAVAFFKNPFLAAVYVPFQGTLGWWFLLNLMAASCLFIAYLKLQSVMPEAFRVRKKEPEFTEDPTSGTARWMTPEETQEILSFGFGPGILFGALYGEPVRLDSRELNENVLCFGPPGSRKTRSLVVPALLQSVVAGRSCVCTDPKGEIAPATAAFFAGQGYEVRVFNLVDMAASDRWNPLGEIKTDLDAQLFADTIIANTTVAGVKKIGSDPFWASAEQNLLKALAIYVINEYEPEKRNMDSLYALLSCGDLNQLETTFGSLGGSHPAKAAWNIYAQADRKTKSDIIQGLGVRIQVFQNDMVRKLTAVSDIDLELPGKKKAVYYCIVSDTDSAFDFLASLFFSFLFIKLIRLADKSGGKCPVRVNFVLDEFCNIGAIPDFKKKIATVRSRGLSTLMITQSLPQLKNRYPNDEWEEIVACCDSQLVFGANDLSTAEYVSERLGAGTVEKLAVRKKALALDPVQVMRSTASRSLLTPDEVMRLPRDRAVLMLGGRPPLMIDKLDYTQHPLGATLPPDLDARIPSHEALPEIEVVFPVVGEIPGRAGAEETLGRGAQEKQKAKKRSPEKEAAPQKEILKHALPEDADQEEPSPKVFW